MVNVRTYILKNCAAELVTLLPLTNQARSHPAEWPFPCRKRQEIYPQTRERTNIIQRVISQFFFSVTSTALDTYSRPLVHVVDIEYRAGKHHFLSLWCERTKFPSPSALKRSLDLHGLPVTESSITSLHDQGLISNRWSVLVFLQLQFPYLHPGEFHLSQQSRCCVAR